MPLSVKDGIKTWIDDFKKSDNPKFDGKSAEKRRDMAIAAYMSAKNESVQEALLPTKDVEKVIGKGAKPIKNVKNSDGTKQSPMSRATTLAKRARDAQPVDEMTPDKFQAQSDLIAKRRERERQDLARERERASKVKSPSYGPVKRAPDYAKKSTNLGENIIAKRAYEIMKPTKSMNHGIEALKKNMKIDHATATNLAKQVMDKVKKGEFKEAVQVDELKKSTIGSYIPKAAQSAAGLAYSAAQKAMSNPDQSGKDYVKSVKRQKGIARATDRLTKEAGTPERLAMIRKAGEKINKEKKKAERDAKRAMAKDKDLMGEAKSFDQKFRDHLKFATSKSPAVQAYMKKRAAD
jgi:hypothetical protein